MIKQRRWLAAALALLIFGALGYLIAAIVEAGGLGEFVNVLIGTTIHKRP